MPTWPSGLTGARVEQLGEDLALTAGTDLASNASANVKGSWVQITASLAFAADGFYVSLADAAATRDYLVDIAVGAAASEVVILENLPYHTGNPSNIGMANAYFPIPLAAGVRIAARCQDSTGSGSVRILVRPVQGSFYSCIRLGGGFIYL